MVWKRLGGCTPPVWGAHGVYRGVGHPFGLFLPMSIALAGAEGNGTDQAPHLQCCAALAGLSRDLLRACGRLDLTVTEVVTDLGGS